MEKLARDRRVVGGLRRGGGRCRLPTNEEAPGFSPRGLARDETLPVRLPRAASYLHGRCRPPARVERPHPIDAVPVHDVDGHGTLPRLVAFVLWAGVDAAVLPRS